MLKAAAWRPCSLLGGLDSGVLGEEQEKRWVATPHAAPGHALFMTRRPAGARQSAN